MIYMLDIETKPNNLLVDIFNGDITAPGNYKDPKKIQQYIAIKRKESSKKMATSQDFSELACIGIKELGKTAKIVSLKDLSDILSSDPSFHLVTFNGKKFDLPIIIKQGIVSNINLPYRELMLATKRFDDSRHTDLMEKLSFGGDYISLDKYCKIYLRKQKKEVDFEKITFDELCEHCLEDLTLTEELYRKFSLIC